MHIILTHENADFDAIASLLGAHKLYPQALPVLPRRINRNVQAFLSLYNSQFPFVDANTLPRGSHVRRVILVDTQNMATVRGMGKDLESVLVLDHHTPPESLPPGWTFRGELVGATTTLLVEAMSARLIPLTRLEATLLLAGIYEDTGGLSYASTTARDLRAAAWLVDREGSLEIANEFLHHPLTPGQRLLYEMLLDHTETFQIEGHTIALAWAEAPADMDEEISTLAHKLRELLEPSALFVLVGLGQNTQLVARSATDDINVADAAQYFGGKGHDRAAAALLRDRPVADIAAELRAALPRFVKPRLTVRDLMSHSVRTVRPETPIAQVSERMRHTGHEGFPVVDAQHNVVGLVTRNAVDRAMQHKWEQQPVQRIMEAGEVTVAPTDSAERVRALMIQRGWGQIPVVAEGKILGVVTRTDLIRLPPSEREQERLHIIRRMEAAFPAPLLTLIRNIGAEASELGSQVYFVGGLVRDLLLSQPIVDVDLVVEGDAIALCAQLTRTYGGDMRKHTRFGTAKWLLAPEVWAQIGETAAAPELPAYIDFVTARTEYYAQPTALPTVEWSSIKQDLHRRDFTINTLAIQLTPGHWGELLDFYGGKADLDAGVIRVLHSLSFVEDPTRILRAARFEARLRFHLDPRSEALIAEALPLLDRVTGGRIRHELELILHEAQPELALERLQSLGALAQIAPCLDSAALDSARGFRARFTRMRAALDAGFWKLDAEGRTHLCWALFLADLERPALEHIAQRLVFTRRLTDALRQLPELWATLAELPTLERPGDVVARLAPLASPLLAAGWLMAEDERARANIHRYWVEWRHLQPRLTGDDLKALGLPPGPTYSVILDALRVARLNGQTHSRADEIALAYTLIHADETMRQPNPYKAS